MESYQVTQPPTSGELLEQATAAYLRSEPLEVVLLSEQEVPRLEPESHQLEVRRLDANLVTGRKTVLGKSALFSSLVIDIDTDPELPAKATAVRAPHIA